MYKQYNGGFIEVICGPMFASKTETLISRITSLQYAKQTIKVYKPELDNRYSTKEIVSHAGARIEAKAVNSSKDIMSDLLSKMEKLPDVVVIDETQFFDNNVIMVAEKLADMGVRVIAAGLDQDFRGDSFPIVAELMARAEIVTKLTAVCTVCGAAATRSQRLVNGEPAKMSDLTVKVGAKESYEARCREHHETDDEKTRGD